MHGRIYGSFDVSFYLDYNKTEPIELLVHQPLIEIGSLRRVTNIGEYTYYSSQYVLKDFKHRPINNEIGMLSNKIDILFNRSSIFYGTEINEDNVIYVVCITKGNEIFYSDIRSGNINAVSETSTFDSFSRILKIITSDSSIFFDFLMVLSDSGQILYETNRNSRISNIVISIPKGINNVKIITPRGYFYDGMREYTVKADVDIQELLAPVVRSGEVYVNSNSSAGWYDGILFVYSGSRLITYKYWDGGNYLTDAKGINATRDNYGDVINIYNDDRVMYNTNYISNWAGLREKTNVNLDSMIANQEYVAYAFFNNLLMFSSSRYHVLRYIFNNTTGQFSGSYICTEEEYNNKKSVIKTIFKKNNSGELESQVVLVSLKDMVMDFIRLTNLPDFSTMTKR